LIFTVRRIDAATIEDPVLRKMQRNDPTWDESKNPYNNDTLKSRKLNVS
jgi:hypothetical protein